MTSISTGSENPDVLPLVANPRVRVHHGGAARPRSRAWKEASLSRRRRITGAHLTEGFVNAGSAAWRKSDE